MIWKSMPLAFRFSLAYGLVFLLAMAVGAQTFVPIGHYTPPPAPQYAAAAPSYSSTAYPSATQPPIAYAAPAGQWGAPVVSAPRVAVLRRGAENCPTCPGASVGSYGAVSPNCAGESCASDCAGDALCAPAMCCAGPVWGGRVGALLLDRNDENHRMFSYDSADESYQLLDSRDGNFDIGGGVQASIIRFDCCTQRGFEIGYWGIYPGEDFAYAYPADVVGDLNGIFNFDQLDYNVATADTFVNTAQVHRMRRQTEIHNAELNWLLGLPLLGGQCSPWRFRALAGFRYMRVADDLQFASDTVDTVFTGAVDELYYNIDVDNNLYGIQFGGVGERQLGASRWSANFGVKAGVFANQADADSFIGGAAGAATINNGPNNGRAWDISADKDDVSLLGELQAGLGFRVAGNWRLLAEYRVVGLSGVALPSNQIYQDLRGLQDVQLLAANGSLLLHGAFFGIERVY